MSTAPTGSATAATATPIDDTEWRTNMKQSYRNAQVRQAAKVLANLEPGATEASKLRLAMQFEDSIFTVATSLADYHKKLTKRLNKLQKTYVPSAANDASSSDNLQKKKEKLIQNLMTKYGNDVKYIVDNAVAAVKEMRDKYGEEKAAQLQQHTDSAKLWAIDLGIIPESEGATPKPNTTMSDAHMERLINHLEKRLSNIRAHVVKLVHPDLFLQESLQRIQDEFKDKGRVVRIQADNMRKRYEQLQNVIASQQNQPGSTTATTAIGGSQDTFDPNKLMIQALEQALKPVQPVQRTSGGSVGSTNSKYQQQSVNSDSPLKKNISTVQQRQQQVEWDIRKRNALMHLEKMRAASTILVAYLCIPDKYAVPQPHALAKAHTIAMEGIEVIQNIMTDLRHTANTNHMSTIDATTTSSDVTTSTATVQLHDAWLKPILIPIKDVVLLDSSDNLSSPTAASSTTPQPVIPQRPTTTIGLRTRVLCTMGRKTPSNFIIALQDKGVTLVRPHHGATYARLEFEQAFVIQIYFVPLLVVYRAYKPNSEESNNDGSNGGSHIRQWPPLHDGLSNRSKTDELLHVNGIVQGKYETVGWMIEEYLQDASAHATNVLRQCFMKTVTAHQEFEIELLEASALLEFVQLARDTYLPKHKDDTTVR